MIKNFYKKIIWLAALVVIIGYFLPLPVLALDYVPLVTLPGASEEGKPLTDPGAYIKGAFNLAIGIAAVLAIIMIIVGGIQYMGTESIGGKGAGLKKIKDAVLGLLLALGSYVLLLTINPSLVNFNVNIGAITPPTAPSVVPTDPNRPANTIALEWQLRKFHLLVANVQYKFEYGIGLEIQPVQLFNDGASCESYNPPGDPLTITIITNCEKVAGTEVKNQNYDKSSDCQLALLPYNNDSSKLVVKSCEQELGAKQIKYYTDNETERAKCLEAARILLATPGNRITILCLK